MTLGLTRKNAFSACQPESSWASLYPVEELKQPSQDSSSVTIGYSKRPQTNTKTDGVRSGSKPLYLPFRRKGITSLPPPPPHRALRVDGCRHGRTRKNKSHIGNKSGPGRAQRGRTNAIIYRCNTSSCKRGARCRTRNGRTQVPSPKTSLLRVHCLNPCKSRYLYYQKIAYAVFMASRKLRHYFTECSITVASEVPLNDIINNRDATGRIAKWAIELLPFDITYKPRRAIKSQVLADFIA